MIQNNKSSLPSTIYNSYHPSSLSPFIRKRFIPFTLVSILTLYFLYRLSITSSSQPIKDHQQSDQNIVSSNDKSRSTSSYKWSSMWPIPSASLWLSNLAHHKNELTAALDGATGGESASWPSPTPPLPIHASLKQRLRAWRMAPLPEPAVWVQFNLQTCSDHRIGKNANVDLLKRAHLMWATMNRTHYRNKREELITHLEKASRKGSLDPQNHGTGRGIVFTAGNADTFVRVLLGVRMLRENLKCELPIEIFSFPGERPTDEIREALTRYNVSFKIVEWAKKDSHRAKNFHIKASALVMCSFREPLYLDSDNLPALLKPGQLENLWESKAYKKLGALFWPDYWKTHADVPIWLLIGTQCRDEWEQEAGQILIDKSRHLDVLLLSEHMLQHWTYWFQISDGDKDIFRYAMLALRKRWALPGRYLGAAGLSWNTQSGYCGHTMLQHDIEGRPLFVHMNLLKQIPSGISRGTTFKRTRDTQIPLLANETLGDWGVEADMLANADENGKAIMDAPEPVRRRAALERGLIPFLHGGSVSAVCVDVRWEDPRTELEKTSEEGGNKGEIEWKNPLEIAQWNADDRLAGFEDKFFDMGGRTNEAAGF